jgi:hypothetical protein
MKSFINMKHLKKFNESIDVLPAKISGSYKSLIDAYKGEDGSDAHIDIRTKVFSRNLDEYNASVQADLFKRCEERHGKLPNYIRRHYKMIFNLD